MYICICVYTYMYIDKRTEDGFSTAHSAAVLHSEIERERERDTDGKTDRQYSAV